MRYASRQGRWVVLATVLGSGMAMLDGTVVNVALPRIGRDLDAGLAALQWTTNGYLLTLSALILLGGSLGDRFGRRRVFVIGVVWFALASALCGLAPTAPVLVAARMLQGVGGALLTPGSLAIISAAFSGSDRGRAIGAWSGLTGLAGAAGPFVGGWVVDQLSWRWAFGINVPLAVVVVAVTARHVPESRGADGPAASQDPDQDVPAGVGTGSAHAVDHPVPVVVEFRHRHDHDPAKSSAARAAHELDLPGAAFAAAALGLVSWALVAWPGGGADAVALVAGAAGLLAAAGFAVVERRAPHPMVPLDLFASRTFSAANAVTFCVYAALGGVLFMLVLTLQVVAGFSALRAGAALLPMTLLMLVLSPRAGALAARLGPRLPMTVGPLLAAAGVAWASRLGAGAGYLTDVVPPVTLLGLGMSVTVAPLTTAVLDAAPARSSGVASGINNAVARSAGLLTVAALPLVVGLDGEGYRDPALLQPAFARAMLLCAALLATGGVLSALLLPRTVPVPAEA